MILIVLRVSLGLLYIVLHEAQNSVATTLEMLVDIALQFQEVRGGVCIEGVTEELKVAALLESILDLCDGLTEV